MTCWFTEGSCNHGTDRHRTSLSAATSHFFIKLPRESGLGPSQSGAGNAGASTLGSHRVL